MQRTTLPSSFLAQLHQKSDCCTGRLFFFYKNLLFDWYYNYVEE